MVVNKNRDGLFVATAKNTEGRLCAGFSRDRLQAMLFCFEILTEQLNGRRKTT
jgi:hypothetical protein